AADKQRIEQHLSSIRELERGLAQAVAARCAPPTLIDTSDYDPLAGLKSDDTGAVKDLVTDAAIPKVGKWMLDMLVMALACDRTSVATFMWTDSEAKHTYPWLDLPETFNFTKMGEAIGRKSARGSAPGTPLRIAICCSRWPRSTWVVTHCWMRAWSSLVRKCRIRPRIASRTCRSCWLEAEVVYAVDAG